MSAILLDAEQRLLAEELAATGRRRYTQTQLWDLFSLHCPQRAARSDSRRALLETLEALERSGALRLPARPGWDRGFSPPLPRSVEMQSGKAKLPREAEAWLPRMAFAASVRHPATRASLSAINRYLRSDPVLSPVVPLRERSVHIFGDEKRLENFLSGANLFGGAMTLAELGTYVPTPPLSYEVQPRARGAPMLVLENHHSFESFHAWNSQAAMFAAVVYGAGNAFAASCVSLPALAERCGSRQVLYLGDLDPEGVSILNRAQNLIPGWIRPHWNLYRWLLRHGQRGPLPATDSGAWGELLAAWPSTLAQGLRTLWNSGERIAQENFGTEELQGFFRP